MSAGAEDCAGLGAAFPGPFAQSALRLLLPADQAGLKEGDQILPTDGILVTDLAALRRQPKTEIGETSVLVVERKDAAI